MARASFRRENLANWPNLLVSPTQPSPLLHLPCIFSSFQFCHPVLNTFALCLLHLLFFADGHAYLVLLSAFSRHLDFPCSLAGQLAAGLAERVPFFGFIPPDRSLDTRAQLLFFVFPIPARYPPYPTSAWLRLLSRIFHHGRA